VIPLHIKKWIKIKPAIGITFIPAKMHKNQPAITRSDSGSQTYQYIASMLSKWGLKGKGIFFRDR
jgi:hypothetical protein